MADNENIEIELDLQILARELAKNKAFIRLIALEIRNSQTKDVRRMGNLYGTTAQRPATPPATQRRLS